MASEPAIIPSAWAANNTATETIPATTSESGKASWDQGFPIETSLPLSQGGIPPRYGDFNGILKALSEFALFAQAGGTFAWRNSLDYAVGSIVVGTDGSVYRAAAASGPSSTAVNPVGDTSGKWERITSQSDLTALSTAVAGAVSDASAAVSTAGAAQSAVTTLDANVVKTSGDQTVGGDKTFTGDIYCKNGNPYFNFIETDTEHGGAVQGYQGMYFLDKNSAQMGSIIFQKLLTSGNAPYSQFRIEHYGNTSSDTMRMLLFREDTLSNWMLMPGTTNLITLGTSNYVWKQVYAQTTTISTSDARLKTQIDAVPDNVLDAWGDVNWQQFQMRDAVAEKGEAKARLHTGLVAQYIDEVFRAHGLDASRYGLFCFDAWEAEPAQYDKEGNIIDPAKEAGDKYSLRYEEALAMEAAYQRRRADRAEARIASLEERLAALEAFLLEAAGTASEAEIAAAEDIDGE